MNNELNKFNQISKPKGMTEWSACPPLMQSIVKDKKILIKMNLCIQFRSSEDLKNNDFSKSKIFTKTNFHILLCDRAP